MIQVSGTYDNGRITLYETIALDKPVKVMVTFLDDQSRDYKRLTISDFGFSKSRELLKNVTGTLSDAVIEERRSLL
jgi:hypothetical protein